MRQIIKIKLFDKECMPRVDESSDWIDLRAAENIHLDCPYAMAKTRKGEESSRKLVMSSTYVPLGIAMQLPAGMEAVVVARSSTNKNFHVVQSNAFGVIDHTYSGPNDQWHMPILATGEVNIKKGDRICQFRMQLSQKATVWQKLKWLFSSGVKIKIVDDLDNPNRGGLGHSGVK